jgi:hypothetical protein
MSESSANKPEGTATAESDVVALLYSVMPLRVEQQPRWCGCLTPLRLLLDWLQQPITCVHLSVVVRDPRVSEALVSVRDKVPLGSMRMVAAKVPASVDSLEFVLRIVNKHRVPQRN